MNEELPVFDLGELEDFFVWQDENPEILFLDVFRFSKSGQVTHRYTLRKDRAKELLRQIAGHLVEGGTLEIPPDGPTKLQ